MGKTIKDTKISVTIVDHNKKAVATYLCENAKHAALFATGVVIKTEEKLHKESYSTKVEVEGEGCIINVYADTDVALSIYTDTNVDVELYLECA